MDLKIDDLLEKVGVNEKLGILLLIIHLVSQQKDNKHLLDLEYVQLNVPKVLGLLNKVFAKRKA
jgi:hypothetical protein